MEKHKNILMIMVAFFVGGSLFILISQINNHVQSVENSGNQAQIFENGTAALGYTPLAGIEGLTKNGSNPNMMETLRFIFRWGIAAAVLLAVLMTIFGGIQYMTSDAMFDKSEGKKKIWSAIAGLLLALSSWIILYTVNPRILQNPQSDLLK